MPFPCHCFKTHSIRCITSDFMNETRLDFLDENKVKFNTCSNEIICKIPTNYHNLHLTPTLSNVILIPTWKPRLKCWILVSGISLKTRPYCLQKRNLLRFNILTSRFDKHRAQLFLKWWFSVFLILILNRNEKKEDEDVLKEPWSLKHWNKLLFISSL